MNECVCVCVCVSFKALRKAYSHVDYCSLVQASLRRGGGGGVAPLGIV